MDDAHRLQAPPGTGSWRVPAYVAVPVVLACGLLGYGISLMLPLHPSPMDPASPQPAQAAQVAMPAAPETLPASSSEGSRIDARSAATTDLSHDRIKIEPAAARIPKSSPRPSVEPAATSPPRPPEEAAAEPKVVPSASTPAEQSNAEPQARRAPRKVRRVYRRPTPKPPAGPVEALFSLVK